MRDKKLITNLSSLKKAIFEVSVSAITREQTVEAITTAAQAHTPFSVAFMPVHSFMTAVESNEFKEAITSFDIVTPDGQPVRWALNHFHKAGLTERVYGPDITLDICAEAAQKGLTLFFYGSTEEVLSKLKENLLSQFPKLIIKGMLAPPFGKRSDQTISQDIIVIKASNADILFVGLGCPKQELFAAKHKEEIGIPILAVGAAFDFHAGTLAQAPAWMQKRGFEWLFRLIKEPRRLFVR